MVTNQPKPIKDIINEVIRELDRGKKHEEDRISGAWFDLIDKKTAMHTKLAALKKGKLIVNVDQSSWYYELNLKKGELLKRLQAVVGKDNLKKLQFKIGEV